MSSTIQICQLNIPFDSRAFFAKISHQPWAMLLDSGNSGHDDAKIDIIVYQPLVTLLTQDDQTQVVDHQAQTSFISNENPFDLVATQLEQSELSSEPTELPFSGGAVGHFSYDLGRQCERLESKAEKDIALAEMAIGIYQHAILFCHKEQSVRLVSRTNTHAHQERKAQILELVTQAAKPRHCELTTPWQHQLSFEQYASRFNKVQHYLRQGDCYQINLTQRFEAQYQGDEYAAYLQLADNNNMPFSAFIRLPQGAILSVSPERFMQSRHGNVQAKPIKGTRPRSDDPKVDKMLANELLSSEKDQSENLMIVDLLRNDLGRCALPGSVCVPKLFDIESFKNVHHLVSTVEAKLPPQTSPLTLLKGAFPGGSITGAPKIRAMNIIDELEPHRRSIYCGSIGYVSADQQMDTNITIRTLLCLDNKIYCWAGGGIVADSTVADEYQECFDKVASILPILAPNKDKL